MPIKIRIEDEQIIGRTYYSILPDQNVSRSKGVTTPSVANLNMLVFVNTSALSVTNFTGGFDGMVLKLLGDGNTTIVNNASIVTNTGANKLLGLHIYELVSYANVWYEK